MRAASSAVLLPLLASLIELAESDICTRQQENILECRFNKAGKVHACGNYTLRFQRLRKDVKRNVGALIELQSDKDCDVEEISIFEGFEVETRPSEKNLNWDISWNVGNTSRHSYVLVSTSNETTFLSPAKSPNSSLEILAYITNDVTLQFFKKRSNRTRRSKAKLEQEKFSVPSVNITFSMVKDRELADFANQRYIVVKSSTKLHCVRWDDEWTGRDCQTLSSNIYNVTCTCASPDGRPLTIAVKTTLDALPHSRPAFPLYVGGTAVSTLFFVATIILLIRFRKRLRDPNRRLEVQINLTISLLLRHIFLLTGFSMALFNPLERRACEAMAVVHAYFLITSVLWVLVEGIMMYRKVCKSALSQPLKNIVLAAVLVWGLPLILMAGVAAYELLRGKFISQAESYTVIKKRLISDVSPVLDISSRDELLKYRKYDFCWTTSQFASIAIGIPVIVSLVVNMIILVWVGIVVWRIRGADKKNLPAGMDQRAHNQTISTFRAVVTLTAILGIPWLFSLFYNIIDGIEKTSSLAPSYVHFTFIFLQGPAVFYLYCAQNHDLKKAFRRSLKVQQVRRSIGSKIRSNSHSNSR